MFYFTRNNSIENTQNNTPTAMLGLLETAASQKRRTLEHNACLKYALRYRCDRIGHLQAMPVGLPLQVLSKETRTQSGMAGGGRWALREAPKPLGGVSFSQKVTQSQCPVVSVRLAQITGSHCQLLTAESSQ